MREACARLQSERGGYGEMHVQKRSLAGLYLVEVVVLVEPEQRRGEARRLEGARIAVEEMELHCSVDTLASVVQTGKPSERAGVAGGQADLLRKCIHAREVSVGVIQARLDGQSAVVALLVPAAVVITGDGCEGGVFRELPFELQRGAVITDVLVYGILCAVVEPVYATVEAGDGRVVVDGMRSVGCAVRAAER